jgi:HlyD family secretion protein
MGKAWRRWLFWGVGAAVLSAGLAYGFWPQPVPVDLVRIAQEPFQVTVDDEGVARIRDVYVVSAPIGGFVQRSMLKVGDRVEKGKTLIAAIQPAAPALLDERNRRAAEAAVKIAEAALTLAQSNLTRSKAELQFSQSERERAERLAQRGIAPERTLEQATADMRAKAAAVGSSEAEIVMRMREMEQARANLIEPFSAAEAAAPHCCVNVMAPVSGNVIKLVTESEAVVTPGTPLAELGNPRDLEIVAEFLSSDAVRMKEGYDAIIEDWGGQPLRARVRRIEPAGFEKVSALGIEEQRVLVRLDLQGDSNDWSRLGHEYRVFVRCVIWKADAALAVPLSALFRRGEDWAVFKVTGGRADVQAVRLGERNLRDAVIEAGLAAGDLVITHPGDRISHGVRVIERQKLE